MKRYSLLANKIVFSGTLWRTEDDLRKYYVRKEADTIEELCDMFIAFDAKSKKHKIYACLVNAIEDYYFDIVYGAIWTDKGLIYVAKMNDKGELKLL